MRPGRQVHATPCRLSMSGGARIRAYVPRDYQSFPESALNRTYSENAARIRREEQALAGNSSNRTLGADEQARGAPAEAAQPSASSPSSAQSVPPRAVPHVPSSAADNLPSPQHEAETPARNSAGATAFLAMPSSGVQLPQAGGISTVGRLLAALALVGALAAVATKQRRPSNPSLSTPLVEHHDV